jgi:hypothetical protein
MSEHEFPIGYWPGADGAAAVSEPLTATDGGADQYIRFADKHVEPILRGDKRVTARLEFERDFAAGDRVDLVDEADAAFATATVATVGHMTATKFVKQDWESHRDYDSLDDFFEEMHRYYPNCVFFPSIRVDVVTFEDVHAREEYDVVRCDGGMEEPIHVTDLPYQCRTCGAVQPLYVSASLVDGEYWIDGHNQRLSTFECRECDEETVHVIDLDYIDAARDGHPIDTVAQMHAAQASDDDSEGIVDDDPELVTDGGQAFETAEVRDGEAPDQTSHASQTAGVKAVLEKRVGDEVLETEKAILEILAAARGELPYKQVEELFDERTEFAKRTASSAGRRLRERGWIESEPNPENGQSTLWSLTETSRAWLRGKEEDR